jgi:hypothetical protein
VWFMRSVQPWSFCIPFADPPSAWPCVLFSFRRFRSWMPAFNGTNAPVLLLKEETNASSFRSHKQLVATSGERNQEGARELIAAV